MTETDRIDEIMDFEDDSLSKLYRAAPKELPVKSLDDAILAASRKAVRSRPHNIGLFNSHWSTRFAVAASIVVAVILLPDLLRQSRKQVNFPTPDPVPAHEVAPMLDTTGEQTLLEPSRTATSQREMRIPDQPIRKQFMIKPAPATLERKKLVPGRRFSLKTAPRAASEAPNRPVVKQSMGRAAPTAPLFQNNYSTFTRNRSAPQLRRVVPSTVSPMASQETRVFRAPVQPKPGKNDLPNIKNRLTAIRQLIKAGEVKAARGLVRQLVTAYPDYLLPKDVQFLVPR
ncbi:MAG TPA: hypothetical protein ENI62_05955 [Gammaproteobacteria bacterium]|nr:hypothetical protein [Gammaproteobacteria bacterium]